MPPLFLLLFLLLLLPPINAECKIRLPTIATASEPSPTPSTNSSTPSTVRVLSGQKPFQSDWDNIVQLSTEERTGSQTLCAGSLIAANWVLTAAQCYAAQFQVKIRIQATTTSNGHTREILKTYPHPDWDPSASPLRNDLQLIQLATPVFGPPTPTPSPSPGAEQVGPTPTPVSGSTEPMFNVMRINNNTAFAMDLSQPRYLRVKGFGLTTRPESGKESLVDGVRSMKFADLVTSGCKDKLGNDGGRRLCTEPDDACGPCFGDTGAPLYDVDKSAKVSVLVGIVTFGLSGVNTADAVQICTSKRRPVVYTAVAPYVPWIRKTVGEQTKLYEFFVPPKGLSDTDLAPKENSLHVAVRASIIVIASLILIGLIGFLVFTCVVRKVRHKRRRWQEGLQAEESFVKAKERDANLIDPFEGIVEDHHSARLSMSSIGRAAVKGATEFSSRSIGAVRAMLMRLEEEDMFMEPREVMDNAPQWVPDAWERLFKAPSKKELRQIHKVATQRVVDDVLEGADKSFEPSLENVAFKNARDEYNLEAAWKKLEIQTSMRNLSEASESSKDVLQSPPLSGGGMAPHGWAGSSKLMSSLSGRNKSGHNNSGRGLRKQGSRDHGPAGLSSLLGPADGMPDVTRADTLLAAFASIDAESEQVAEETVIDSSALRTLAMAKKPNVLAALRKKFSSGSSPGSRNISRGNSDRDPTGDVLRSRNGGAPVGGSSSQADGGAATIARQDSPLPVLRVGGMPMRGNSGHAGPGNLSSALQLLSNSGRSFNRGFSSSGWSGSDQSIAASTSRVESMRMDYFSEDYTLSDSSSDDDDTGAVMFDDGAEGVSRRFTEDRLGDVESVVSTGGGHGFRKGPIRSFESFDSIRSREEEGERDRAVPMISDPAVEEVRPEGCVIEEVEEEEEVSLEQANEVLGSSGLGSSWLGLGRRRELSLSAMNGTEVDEGGASGSGTVVEMDESGESRSGTGGGMGESGASGSWTSGETDNAGSSAEGVVIEGEYMRAEGSMGGGPKRLRVERVVEMEELERERSEDGLSDVIEEAGGRVEGLNQISVAILKELWNDMAHRDSGLGSVSSRGSGMS